MSPAAPHSGSRPFVYGGCLRIKLGLRTFWRGLNVTFYHRGYFPMVQLIDSGAPLHNGTADLVHRRIGKGPKAAFDDCAR